MRKILLVPCLLLATALPGVASAQEEEAAPQPTLVLSHFKCDWNRISDVWGEFELQVPIWEELVAEGMMASRGTYVHVWADEWNVGLYTVAESIEAALAANAEAGSRFAARHPDADVVGEACPQHRDAFYQFGPVADASSAPSGGNPTLVMSMYQCDFGRIGDVFDEFEQYAIPVFDAMIEEGKLRGAGTFGHTWASEWNVGFYFVAEDLKTFIDAWDEAGERINAASPEGPSAIGEACPVHKDAFYGLGPRTGMGEAEEGGS